MKLSHVIVAIVFFLLGAACVHYFAGRACQQTGQSGTAVGFVFGVHHNQNAASVQGGLKVTTAPKAEKAQSSAVSGAPQMSFRIEKNVNRHGSDYRDFEMAAKDGFEVCQKACADDAKCLAFTFVKAGIQGATAHCWLKNTVPQAYPDTSCVSGVKD